MFLTTKYTTVETQTMGNEAEKQFKQIAEKNKYSVTVVTEQENINDHIDFKIEPYFSNVSYSVDVKSMKNRYGVLQTDKVLIELKNVIGRPGWIYGKADLIAFQTPEGFLIFNREQLKEYTENYIKYNPQALEHHRFEKSGMFVTLETKKVPIDAYVWLDLETLKQELMYDELCNN